MGPPPPDGGNVPGHVRRRPDRSSRARVLDAHDRRGPHQRQPHRRRRPQRGRGARRGGDEPPRRCRRLDRRDRSLVPRPGTRRRQGPGRRGHRARRPGGADVEDTLRVDAAGLRHLVRRCCDGAGLRDLLGGAGRLDPRRLRRPCRRHRGPRAHSPGHRGPRRPRGPPSRVVLRRQRGRRPVAPGCRRRRRAAGATSYDGDTAGPGDDHLHLRHDRTPEGLHAHARQLPLRAGRGHRGARVPLRDRGRLHGALPPAGARLRPDHPGGLRHVAHPPGPQPRHQEPAAGPAVLPPDLRARRAAGLREGLQHRLPEGGRRGPRQGLRPGHRDRHRLVARTGPGAGPAEGPGRARRLQPARLRQAPRRARRQLHVRGLRRSPATGATSRPRPRPSSATGGSTAATSARSTTRASCASPAARRRSW